MGDSTSTSRVAIGHYELEVGAPAGTIIAARADNGDPAALARALRERPPRDLLGTANEATARVEDGVGVVNDVLKGALLDPQRAVKDVDLLLELLQRLVNDGRLADALRVARNVNGALALLMRWADLVRSLRVALEAAKRLGDRSAIAWAHHELGTLYVVAEDPKAAQRHLDEARAIRRELGDQEGLAATEQNMVHLCRQLREMLRDGRLRLGGRRTLVLAIAMVLLFCLGAVARAVVHPPPRAELIAWVEGQGRVTSTPSGIDCRGGRCNARYSRGEWVELSATRRAGSRFAGWRGDCTGRGTCVVRLNRTRTVTARFVPAPHPSAPRPRTLHIHKDGDGLVASGSRRIDCGQVCTAHLRRGSHIRLTATAAARATFTGWGGACHGTGPCELTIRRDTSVTAHFRRAVPEPTPKPQPTPVPQPKPEPEPPSTPTPETEPTPETQPEPTPEPPAGPTYTIR